MTKVKQKILELGSQGKSYREIREILNCSLGTISFHLGIGQKEKSRIRCKKAKSHPFYYKLACFLLQDKNPKFRPSDTTKLNLIFKEKIRHFSSKTRKGEYMAPSFNIQDVIEKFGENPKCYLTGEQIDIQRPRTYSFDHIIPRSRGGKSTLENLGICTKRANASKTDMTPEEYAVLCKQVLENLGYTIIPPTKKD